MPKRLKLILPLVVTLFITFFSCGYILAEDSNFYIDYSSGNMKTGTDTETLSDVVVKESEIASITMMFSDSSTLETLVSVADIQVPWNCEIQSVTLLAGNSGSIQFDLWVDSYENYPPTVGDTITASAKPAISSDTKYTDSTLDGWSKLLLLGDVIRVYIDSCVDITRCSLILKVKK